jgi:alkylation response protein AidB-like acyl-CoA dehydrogenase
MTFELSAEQQAMFDMAKAFAAAHVAPNAEAWEAAGEMPRSALKAVADLGMAAIYVREEWGGSGLSRLDATLIFEGLASGCPAFAAFVSIHNMCGNSNTPPIIIAISACCISIQWLAT